MKACEPKWEPRCCGESGHHRDLHLQGLPLTNSTSLGDSGTLLKLMSIWTLGGQCSGDSLRRYPLQAGNGGQLLEILSL